jgi:anti-sigma B factor antagonist
VIVQRSEIRPGLVLVTVQGEVDLTSADELRAALIGAVTEGRPREIQVHLAAVPFMDSMGISALIAGYRAAVAAEADFRLVEPSRPLVGVLAITGLLDVFGYHPSGEPPNSSMAR